MSLLSSVNVLTSERNSQVDEILNNHVTTPPGGGDKDVSLLKSTLQIIHWLGDVSLTSSFDKEKGKVTADKLKRLKINLKEFLERYKIEKEIHLEIENKLKECEGKLKTIDSEENKEKGENMEENLSKSSQEQVPGKTDKKVDDIVKEYEVKIETLKKESEERCTTLETQNELKLTELKVEHERKVKVLKEDKERQLKELRDDFDSKLKAMEVENQRKMKAFERKIQGKLKRDHANELKKAEEGFRKSLGGGKEELEKTVEDLKTENEALKKSAIFYEAQSHLKDGIVEYYKREADAERQKRINSELAMQLTTMDLNDPAKIVKPHDESSIEEITSTNATKAIKALTAKDDDDNTTVVVQQESSKPLNKKRAASSSPKKRTPRKVSTVEEPSSEEKKPSDNSIVKAKKRSADSILVQEAFNSESGADTSLRWRPRRNTRPPSRLSQKIQIPTAVEREGEIEIPVEEKETLEEPQPEVRTESVVEGSYTNYEIRKSKEESSATSESESSTESESEAELMKLLAKGKKRKHHKKKQKNEAIAIDLSNKNNKKKEDNVTCFCGKLSRENCSSKEGNDISDSKKCDYCGGGLLFPSLPKIVIKNVNKHSPTLADSDAKSAPVLNKTPENTVEEAKPTNGNGPVEKPRKLKRKMVGGGGNTWKSKKKKLGDIKKKGNKRHGSSSISTLENGPVPIPSTKVNRRYRSIPKKKGRPAKEATKENEADPENSMNSEESIVGNLGIDFHHRIPHPEGWACKCGKTYSNDERLKYHIIAGLFGDLFKCNQENCGIIFHHFKVYKNHMLNKHGIGMSDKYGCLLCGVQFETFKGLRDHYKECPNRSTLDQALSLEGEGKVDSSNSI